YSPFCCDPSVCRKYGNSLQDRLDTLAFSGNDANLPTTPSEPPATPVRAADPTNQGNDDSQQHVGTSDPRPYSAWRRLFNISCRQYGLSGDGVAIFYALIRCLSPALQLVINPAPPGVGPIQGWTAEVNRIFDELSRSCSGVSDSLAQLSAQQSFSAILQKADESVCDFSMRFSDAAAELASYKGELVADDVLRTTYLKALSAPWRKVALDLLQRCNTFDDPVQGLAQRERLERAVAGPESQSNRPSRPPTPVTGSKSVVAKWGINVVDGSSVDPKPSDNEKSEDDVVANVTTTSSSRRRHRQQKHKPCYNMQRTGFCRFGDRCKYSHDPAILA
ncbi:hypothetical protein FOZ62_011138, partial [Perkinsus olseni]